MKKIIIALCLLFTGICNAATITVAVKPRPKFISYVKYEDRRVFSLYLCETYPQKKVAVMSSYTGKNGRTYRRYRLIFPMVYLAAKGKYLYFQTRLDTSEKNIRKYWKKAKNRLVKVLKRARKKRRIRNAKL